MESPPSYSRGKCAPTALPPPLTSGLLGRAVLSPRPTLDSSPRPFVFSRRVCFLLVLSAACCHGWWCDFHPRPRAPWGQRLSCHTILSTSDLTCSINICSLDDLNRVLTPFLSTLRALMSRLYSLAQCSRCLETCLQVTRWEEIYLLDLDLPRLQAISLQGCDISQAGSTPSFDPRASNDFCHVLPLSLHLLLCSFSFLFAYSSFTNDSPSLETTQMCINQWMA